MPPLILYEEITDDNRSRSNSLSGLDQVILFQAGEYFDDVFNLDFVKARIILQIAFLKKEMQEREDEEERNKREDDEDWDEDKSL